MTHQFTPQETSQHIVTLGVVAQHIDEIIGIGVRSECALHDMQVNIGHIRIMCAKQHIIETGTDLTLFLDAADRGAEWLA
jgi:hypothetical protein